MSSSDVTGTNIAEERRKIDAARKIQHIWRQRRNKARDLLDSEGRWEDAMNHAKLDVIRADAKSGTKNSPKDRWRRAVYFASRIRDRNHIMDDLGLPAREFETKDLEAQHWLELIDKKHRYGSNLKWYHKRWQEDKTTENFFRWLDEGGGKDLSLDAECTRQQLESERIVYLSAEQRLNYLVNIDSEGLIRWARNDEPVDTTAGQWEDAGHGGGIIRSSRQNKGSWLPRLSVKRTTSDSSDEEDVATHYAGRPVGEGRWDKLKRSFTPQGMMDRLLRITVRKNTWIYITDKNFNLFVGIKETGAFQHSSFLAGGYVTSAGLITAKSGLVYDLSPLSGHYRTTTDHFHQFVEVMEERGLDMRKARVSKAELALWGMERLKKFSKKKAAVKEDLKQHMPHKGQEDVTSAGAS